MQSPPFENLLNFRDVAETVNPRSTKGNLRRGLLYRSARPDETSPSDREKLISRYKVKTILDLRTKTEHLNAAKKHTEIAVIGQPALVPVPSALVTAPLKIPNIRYIEINLNGKGFERSLVWQLSYVNLAKLIVLMALGYRMEAISILGREVLQKRGLVGLGIDTLNHSGPEVKEVFDLFANEDSWPVLVHCTQGKDRTGLVVLLVLLLCGIETDAITQDYVLSEKELAGEKEERMKEISSIGLDESFAKCPPDFVIRVQQHVESQYGGIEAYLRSIGVSKEQQQQIRTRLLQKVNS